MITYDEILESMKSKYLELSGNQVAEYSDIDIRMKVLAGELYKEVVNLEFIKNQMFVNSATGEYLDRHGADRGLSRKSAVKAKGKVKFSLATPLEVDLVVPKGTVVSTSGSIPYQYTTNSDGTISAGETSVTLSCTAVDGGVASNAVIGAVNVLVTAVPGIETVKNKTAFIGGTDEENDESFRQRIIESYNSISNGTNKAYYKSLALSVSGVTEASVVPKVTGAGSVDVYICSERQQPTDTLVNKVQELMDEAREVNVIVFVIPAKSVAVNFSISISIKDGYSFKSVSDKVRKALEDYVNTSPIGQDLIENHIAKVVMSVEGVYNFSYTGVFETEYAISNDSFPVVGTIIIEEMF